MWATKPYRDSVALQKQVLAAAKDCETKELSSLVKSFVMLEYLKLRLRMQPAPKPVDVAKMVTQVQDVRAKQTFIEDLGSLTTSEPDQVGKDE